MRRPLRVVLAATFVLAACSSTGSSPAGRSESPHPGTGQALPAGDRGRVDRVVDGDTIVVDGRRIRLIGIDAPESVKPDSPVECFGPEASEELSRLLPRRTSVLLEYDVDRTDRYGRTLAYVWRPDPPRLVNLALVRRGFATADSFPPNVRHQVDLDAAEDRARDEARGLWAACR